MTSTEETQVGKWIGWNGGECPVHPRTIIEAARIGTYVDRREAGQFQDSNWTETGHSYSIVAYRIIKEHREPREFWLLNGIVFSDAKKAFDFIESYKYLKLSDCDIVHVRELIE